jgi:hypothetical protein
LQLVRGLHGLNLVGFDLVEVSPPYDHGDITAMLASNIVFEYLSLLALKKQGVNMPNRFELSFTDRSTTFDPSDTPELDARVLLAISWTNRAAWWRRTRNALTRSQLAAVKKAVARLEAGEPFPYVLGHWEFFGLDFELSPDVLIPRPKRSCWSSAPSNG